MCRIHHTHGVITRSEEALHVTDGMQNFEFPWKLQDQQTNGNVVDLFLDCRLD